jgi:hypothetical protein
LARLRPAGNCRRDRRHVAVVRPCPVGVFGRIDATVVGVEAQRKDGAGEAPDCILAHGGRVRPQRDRQRAPGRHPRGRGSGRRNGRLHAVKLSAALRGDASRIIFARRNRALGLVIPVLFLQPCCLRQKDGCSFRYPPVWSQTSRGEPMQRRDLNAPDAHPPVAVYTHAIEVSGATYQRAGRPEDGRHNSRRHR